MALEPPSGIHCTKGTVMTDTTTYVSTPASAPTKAVWIILALAWICFLIPFPGLGMFLGWPLNLVAFILAIVVIARGRTGAGITQLICTLIVSPIVYFIGLAIFTAAMQSGT